MPTTQIWYKDLGFSRNPFSIKPGIINDKLVGNAQVLDNITDFIKTGGIGSIIGNFGVGKTTLLKSIIRRFAGRRKVIYFSCNRLTGPLDVQKLLHERFGVIGRFLKIKSYNMILLLDEAHHLSKKDCTSLLNYHKKQYFKTIILVSNDKTAIQSTAPFRKLINNNTFELTPLDKAQAVEMARKRIGQTTFISDAMFKKIFEHSVTPRSFLKQCEDVCRIAYRNNHKRVLSKDIKETINIYAEI